MAVLKPEHFLDQAERLLALTQRRPRQVDVRRAISAACYGVFHLVCAGVADQHVGVTYRDTARYALAYRSVDHGACRRLCEALRRTTLTQALRRFAPLSGFSVELRQLAASFRTLQDGRHSADYDPVGVFSREMAEGAITEARQLMALYDRLDAQERATFLTLAAFPARA